ncbi:triose-phosphate isomerase [Gallicola sp. Sow4_E12]|uniref:triose-phosphate isomerase n=1 Tax=Gallicola sp. Sow4_E12 TaxID=3438785 RepID=UPI003F921804
MRKPIIAGNWKMNNNPSESIELVKEILKEDLDGDVEQVVIVPFTSIYPITELLKEEDLKLGAQNMYFEESGAYTGEVSPLMLKDLDVDYVIVGHSERREIFNEDDNLLNKKVASAFSHGLIPILCCGETLEEREENKQEEKVKSQIAKDLEGIAADNVKKLVIAYEPIWAIGTGKTASSDDAEAMCGFIRGLIEEIYDKETADSVRIQYGGSVKPENVKDIMSKENIDGALVGGASLKSDSFAKLVNFKK